MSRNRESNRQKRRANSLRRRSHFEFVFQTARAVKSLIDIFAADERHLGNNAPWRFRATFEPLEARLALAGVVLNEILADNVHGIIDQDSDHSDWIELKNTTAAAVNLNGWYLTDDAANPTKWQFPSTTIAAGGFATVFASGKNRRVAGQELHTNFQLDNDGEYLALVMPDGATVADAFAPFPPQLPDVSYGVASSTSSTVDDYLVNDNAPLKVISPTGANLTTDSTWFNLGFNDASWTSGTTAVGFDTNSPANFTSYINTTISLSHNTAYIRVPFSVASKDDLSSLQLQIRYDDAFVAYINGTQVFATNNAPGMPAYNSSATSAHDNADAVQYTTIDLTPYLYLLANGNNVLGIQGMNYTGTTADANDFLIDPLLVAKRAVGSSLGFMATPTPGAANVLGTLGFVGDTHFSEHRGFFTAPIDVAISTDTPGAQIRYTLDGSAPTATTGLVYSSPVHIATTATLRAAAFLAGYTPSNIDTETYVFPADVAHQSGAGLPPSATWGSSGPDWEMDSDIVNNPTYSGSIVQSLESLPTVSLVLPWNDMFGGNGQGIYIQGSSTERAVSTEYFTADKSQNFQIDAAVEIQGGSSDDRWKDDKLSMQLKFKAPYGPTKLNEDLFNDPLFDTDATTKFDTLILDGVLNNSWVHPDQVQRDRAMFVQDQVVADLQNMAGGAAPHGRYVQLYLDGVYWGVYYLHERPDDSFASTYLDGDKDDYDVLKHNPTTVVSGGQTAVNDYATLLTAVRKSMTNSANYQAVTNLLDIDGFIDYMVINYYAGNTDWAQHNWYATYNRVSGTGKWRFHSWDAEHVFETLSDNLTTKNDTGGPTEILTRLMANSEFKLRFDDHVQKLMANGGLLTPTKVAAVYTARINQIYSAMIAESARWGDNRSPNLPYTRDGWWNYQQNTLLVGTGSNTPYFPNRTATVLSQFSAAGWLQSLSAPVFTQYGGTVNAGYALGMSKPSGSPAAANIYYTTNGTDPRLSGGTLNSAAKQYTGTVVIGAATHVIGRIRNVSGSTTTWSPAIDVTFLLPSLFPLRIVELNYHPADHVGVADPDDLEFIELENIGTSSISLNGIQITQFAATPYTFPNGLNLAAGQRIVVAKNPGVFQSVYGTHINMAATGYGTANLSNSGERVALLGPLGETLQDFVYDDSAPWPTAADGDGPSLEYVGPLDAGYNPAAAAPDDPFDDPTNWRASLASGGSPGIARDIPGDYNRNGVRDLGDLDALFQALTDLSGYRASHPLSDSEFQTVADLDGDHVLTNADIQRFLGLLIADASHSAAIGNAATVGDASVASSGSATSPVAAAAVTTIKPVIAAPVMVLKSTQFAPSGRMNFTTIASWSTAPIAAATDPVDQVFDRSSWQPSIFPHRNAIHRRLADEPVDLLAADWAK